jgi:hypothetical protein
MRRKTCLGSSSNKSVRKIAKHLGYPNHVALNTYVKKRGLRPNCS